MSHYHFEAKPISRKSGGSFARTANYISGISLHDSYLGKDYYRKRQDVLWTSIILPSRAPPELYDLQTLCDRVEAAERRYDARTARQFIGALPNELSLDDLIKIVKGFVSENFVEHGLGIVAAIHEGKNKDSLLKNNPHVHILVTTRTIGPDGLSQKKDREHDNRKYMEIWREQWAEVQNRAYERAGLDIRVSHDSLEVRGEGDREPLLHLSPIDWQRERSGERTRAGDKNREIQERNRQRQQERVLLLERELCVERSR